MPSSRTTICERVCVCEKERVRKLPANLHAILCSSVSARNSHPNVLERKKFDRSPFRPHPISQANIVKWEWRVERTKAVHRSKSVLCLMAAGGSVGSECESEGEKGGHCQHCWLKDLSNCQGRLVLLWHVLHVTFQWWRLIFFFLLGFRPLHICQYKPNAMCPSG